MHRLFYNIISILKIYISRSPLLVNPAIFLSIFTLDCLPHAVFGHKRKKGLPIKLIIIAFKD